MIKVTNIDGRRCRKLKVVVKEVNTRKDRHFMINVEDTFEDRHNMKDNMRTSQWMDVNKQRNRRTNEHMSSR